MSILEQAPAAQRGEVVCSQHSCSQATPYDFADVIARHARSVADWADLMAMFYDEPQKRNAPVRPRGPRAECGSIKAYRQHLQYGEPTCDVCRRANADHVAASEKKRRGRQEADPRARAECGTNRAYHQHMYYGEPTDDACKKAHSRAESAYDKARRQRRALSTGEAT